MNELLKLEDLTFEVRRSTRRRSLELVVERDGSLRVIAPDSTGPTALAAFVREKRSWLYSKLAEKDALHRRVSAKQYVSGESFSYLGRHYRLLLVDHQEAPLRLSAGRFRLKRGEATQGRKHFQDWYIRHGQDWLQGRVPAWAKRLGVAPVEFEVRDLGYRWGSCGKKGKVYFHWASVLASPTVVDYVIVHELSHLFEAHHTPAFWRRVERAMPDFLRRREELRQFGAALNF